MSKAILVVDTPKKIEDCYAKDAIKFGCILFDKGSCKLKNCPLRQMEADK